MYRKVARIRARLGLGRMQPAEKLMFAKTVYGGLIENPDFPDLPIDPDEFKGTIDALASALQETLDGGKNATAKRKRQEKILAGILLHLARYVEYKCNDNLETFLSSGFTAISNDRRRALPLSEAIRKIERGATSGQLLLRLVAVPDAAHYELRWAPVDSSGAPESWTIRHVFNTRPATLIAGLTPGTGYVFEARALTPSGHTDWRGPVIWICT